MSDKMGIGNFEAYRHQDPIVDQALDWAVLLKASGPLPQETMRSFEEWVDAHSSHRKAWEEVSMVWGRPEVMIASAGLMKENRNISRSPSAHQAVSRGQPRWRAGALSAVVAAILIVLGPDLYRIVFIDAQADFKTAIGQVQKISLPDGSIMALDTQSAVAIDFAGNVRSVRLLKGDAWFDVVHDATRPFRVSARFSEIEVKGTAFSVGTDDETDTVIVERGLVRTTHSDAGIASVDLKAGEMLEASAASLSPAHGFDPDQKLSWREGRIVFADMPLKTALNTLGRYHDGGIMLLNSSLQDIAISGSYRTDNAEAAIDSAVTAAGGKATHLPGGIIIIH